MGNHKRTKSPRHITKYGTKYKTKGNRHEMHSVKWVVHVCKSRGNKWYRERENSQRNEQRSCIFRLPQKKLHLLNLTPSDLWQEQYHIWSTQTYHLCPIIWKLLVHHSVSKSLCQMLNDLSIKSNCLETSDLETMMLSVESDVNIFWYSLETIQRLHVRWTHGRVVRLQRVFKARVPTSTDPGSNRQTI